MLRANFCVVLFPKSLYSYIDTQWRRSSSRKKFQTASASTLPKFIWNIRDNDLKIARKVLLEEFLRVENRLKIQFFVIFLNTKSFRSLFLKYSLFLPLLASSDHDYFRLSSRNSGEHKGRLLWKF